MATMRRSEELEDEEMGSSAIEIAGYSSDIDAIREKEFPMLQGMLAELHMLGSKN